MACYVVWCGGLKASFLCTEGHAVWCGVGGRRPASSALKGMLCGVVWGVEGQLPLH